MNIKEIVLKAGHSTVPAYWLSDEKPIACSTSNFERLVSFAEALIAELSKQNEPLCTAAMLDEWFLSKSGLDPKLPLYTSPPTAEQTANETAKAIAEYCSHQGHYCLSAEIESGEWKEFKK